MGSSLTRKASRSTASLAPASTRGSLRIQSSLTQDNPYQGQPYGPPPGQQPYPGPGYGYGPQPPRRRKRHRVPHVITGVAVAIIGIIVIAAIASAGKGSHTVTTGQAATPRSSASKAAKPGGAGEGRLDHHSGRHRLR